MPSPYGRTVGQLIMDSSVGLYDAGSNLVNFAKNNPEASGLVAGQFAPGAATADFYGRYPDPMNPSQTLPSAGQNISQGNILDAAFQSAGLLGDAFYAVAPFTAGAAAVPGAALSAPRAAQLARRLTDAEKQAQDVIDLLKSGKADEVSDEMLGKADPRYLSENYDLPMDPESRMARAREMGFDVDSPMYHGTHSDEILAFDDSKIGLRDEGFYGSGHYFTPHSGEARYYGPNVGEYNLKGNFLDLSDRVGDKTLGDPEYFKWWANELDKIDMLDEPTQIGLSSLRDIDKYVDENISYALVDNADGSTGYMAMIADPTREPRVYKDKTYLDTIDTPFRPRHHDQQVPLTKEEAKNRAKRKFIDEMQYSSKSPFKGLENILYSLSDYVRVGGKGPLELSEQASKAGYDGIRVGDETVVFEPKNIRSPEARFDPRLKDLKNLTAGGAGLVAAPAVASGLLAKEKEDNF